MVLPEDDVANLIADLERAKRELERAQQEQEAAVAEKELQNGNMRRNWSGSSRKMWRCRCSPCWRDRSSQRRRQWHLLQKHLRLK